LPKQVASAWSKIIRLSLPNGFVDSMLEPITSLTRNPSAQKPAAEAA
jgi:hypothetical protein